MNSKYDLDIWIIVYAFFTTVMLLSLAGIVYLHISEEEGHAPVATETMRQAELPSSDDH